MPDPDDRVLVCVINRKRDLEFLLRDHWYRIPIFAVPGCVDYAIIAFYLSTGVRQQVGAVAYYAELRGFELVRRRELIPTEWQHPRANEVYFKLQFREIIPRTPPILNAARRPITFIMTDWQHLDAAQILSDLYLRRKLDAE